MTYRYFVSYNLLLDEKEVRCSDAFFETLEPVCVEVINKWKKCLEKSNHMFEFDKVVITFFSEINIS